MFNYMRFLKSTVIRYSRVCVYIFRVVQTFFLSLQ